ncbi:MAG: hypothetical protein ACLS5O_09755 [[Clostridium] leptum]
MSFENIIYFPLHLLLIDSMSFLFCIWIHYTPKPINSQQIIPAITNFLKNFHNLHNSGFLFLPGLSERHKTEAEALVFSAPESFKAALLTFRRFHAGEGDTLIRPAASIDTARLFSAALIKPGVLAGQGKPVFRYSHQLKTPLGQGRFQSFL